MYLDYFKLKEYPFSQALNTNFYYQLQSHQEALDILLVSLRMKDGIIKITGEPGSGKTFLCKLVLEKLGSEFHPIYLPNPYLSYDELMQTISDELNISDVDVNHNIKLSKAIYNRLLEIQEAGKHVVLIFDEAQALSKENLEYIRILSNMENGKTKCLQIVLMGGLELDEKLRDEQFNHLNQRITFSYRLMPIEKEDINGYIQHRLTKAALDEKSFKDVVVTPQASKLLYHSTGGSPRLINTLCHKALMLAYSKGDNKITYRAVSSAINDTHSIRNKVRMKKLALFGIGMGAIAFITFLILFFTL